jgi:CBS domain-containing protein
MAKKVADIMTKSVVMTNPEASITDTCKLMADKGVGSVVVVEANKLVGIVTERDIVRRALAAGKEPTTTKINEIMSKPVTTTTPTADVGDATELMRLKNVRRLPVLDKNRVLVGIVTSDDIIAELPTPRTQLIKLFGFDPRIKHGVSKLKPK